MKKASLYLMVLLYLLITGCSGGGGAADKAGTKGALPPVAVITQKVEKSRVDREITASGNIEGNRTARLGFLVAGKINYIAGEEGTPISAGQLLASLDPESYRIARDMADAGLAQVQDEYNRLSFMHERKSLADADFAKISSALKAAKAQQQLQNKNLLDTKLYAPFSGVLLKKLAEVGEIIGPGMPLFAVSDISTVKVIASIPETDLQLVKTGSAARVYISSLDQTVTGRVTEIGSLSEPATRSFSAKILLRNPGWKIRPGMTAEIKIASGKKAEIIAVPGEAVLREPDNSAYVFVADQAKSQAVKRRVSLGQMAGNSVEITSGLETGEIIVVGGQHKLNDGSPVTLK